MSSDLYGSDLFYSIQADREKGQQITILDVQYRKYVDNGEELAEIVLYTREDGLRNRHLIRGFLPYIYVDISQEDFNIILDGLPILRNWIIRTKSVNKIIYNTGKHQPLLKLYGKQPWLVPSIRNTFQEAGISYFEADIPFTHRFMIDHNLNGFTTLGINKTEKIDNEHFSPLVCSFDIEIDSSYDDNFEEIMEQAQRRVTAIGFSWGSADKDLEQIESRSLLLEADSDEAERLLIRQSFEFLWSTIDPDILVTYNGDKFDFVYLTKRMKELEIPLTILSPYQDLPYEPAFGNGWQIPGVVVFDLFKKTRYIYTPDGRKTLGSVAQEKLGIDKLELTIDHGKLWHHSLNNMESRQELAEYLKRDVQLTYRLWFALDMDQWLEVIKISGGPPGDAIYFTERQAGEFIVFRTMYNNDILIPPAPSTDEKKKRKKDRKSAQGGLVLDPIRDLTEAVLICDFASMYPSIIVAHNIGGESFDPRIANPIDRFSTEPQTSMALMQRELLKKRYEVKDQLKESTDKMEFKRLKAYSWGLKIAANSTFGSYNFIGSRFYDTELAGTITEIGRNYLKSVAKRVEAFDAGYKTIYGDTDSVFIETPLIKEIKKLWDGNLRSPYEIDAVEKLMKYLHDTLPTELNLELEDVAYRILFHRGAKKRYAYVSAITRETKIMGFEAIRNDFSPFAKAIQKFAFDILLRTGDLSISKQNTVEYIQSQLHLPNDQLKELCITFGPLRRNPKKYKSPTSAISAFLHYQQWHKEITWRDYDFFPYIITKGSSAQKDRARHPDLVDFDDIDFDHYLEEALRSINRFNIDISLDEAKGIVYSKLSDFFD